MKVGRRSWFKLFAERTLHGTTTKELELPERWVWIGYLCLAADSPVSGIACVARGVPYTTSQVCRLLDVPPAILKRATEKMVAAGKISVNGEGVHITNWEHYQGDYVRKQKERAAVTNVTPEPDVTNVTDRGRGRGRGRGREEGEEEEEPSLPPTPSPTGAAGDDLHEQFFGIYQSNIGDVTPRTARTLRDLSTRYSVEWFEDAVREACLHNHRHLGYITKILSRWQKEGKDT